MLRLRLSARLLLCVCAAVMMTLLGAPLAAETWSSSQAKNGNNDNNNNDEEQDEEDLEAERERLRHMLAETEARLAHLLAQREEIDDQIERMQNMMEHFRARLREIAEVPGIASPERLAEHYPSFRYAIAATRQRDFRRGGTLRLSFSSRIGTASAYVSSTASASSIQQYVLESLAVRDPRTHEWQPHLAQAWHVSEDGLTFRFLLREDIRFSDGEPVTARDVAFTHRFIMDPRIGADRARITYGQVEVEALDERRVEFRFEEPYFRAFEICAGLSVLPRHIYGKYLETDRAAEEYNFSRDILVGSGPYTLASRATTLDSRIVLTRNRRYWGPVPPPFDSVEYSIILEDDPLDHYDAGRLDLLTIAPEAFDELRADEQYADATFFEYLSISAGYTYIGWNQFWGEELSPFGDRNVRQAMTYLVDRQRILDEVFHGRGIVATGPFHPNSNQHPPDLEPRERCLDTALELLELAGYRRHREGLLDFEGEKLSFTLIYPAGAPLWDRAMRIIRQGIGEAGIEVELEPMPFDVLIERLNERDFDAIALGWTSGFEIDINQMFHSSNYEFGENFVSHYNVELDRAMERAISTVDETERMRHWQRAARIVYDDQPYTFLHRRNSLILTSPRLRNVTADTRSGLNYHFPIEWYLAKEEEQD